MAPHRPRRPGFTLTELLVVIALIAVLLSLLLPALGGVLLSGKMASSMGNLKQISEWCRMYSTDNREFIVPSRFDYDDPDPDAYRGKVRSQATIGEPHKGTWTDILWTVCEVGAFPEAEAGQPPCDLGQDYRYDSPDFRLYACRGGSMKNPFRAAAPNSFDAAGSGGFQGAGTGMPTPFGPGAREKGSPGYFAANDFFSSVDTPAAPGQWYTTGEIVRPERSMYVVDSFAGETIAPLPEPFATDPPPPDIGFTQEVDFRYTGWTCLMLFLDDHVEPVTRFQDLADLEDKRGIRVRDLTMP